jgi:hypothetical protein
VSGQWRDGDLMVDLSPLDAVPFDPRTPPETRAAG